MKGKTLAVAAMLVFLAFASEAPAQMGGGMMGPRSGMGQGGMGGGQGYGPGYESVPEQKQTSPNFTAEERKARDKAFVEEFIRQHLPEYTLEKKNNKKGK